MGPIPRVFPCLQKLFTGLRSILKLRSTHNRNLTPTITLAVFKFDRHRQRCDLHGADAGSKLDIERLCVELNLSELVEFNDVAPYDDMPRHYDWADVMLHTSLSEGQCMALTEAAACGVLMAGTNVAPLYDLGEKCGIIIQRGDYKRLSSQILELLEKPAEWHQKVRFAREWVEAHPLDWTITQIKSQLMTL